MDRKDSFKNNLIFIIGSPRSGTTWLQKIIASHPDFVTGQESDIFDLYIGPQLKNWEKYKNPYIEGRNALGLACYLTEEEFKKFIRDYTEKLMKKIWELLEEKKFFIEKTPSNALFIKEILFLFPNTKFIHILRDPREVILSLNYASKTWGKNWAPKTISSAFKLWEAHYSAVLRNKSLIPKENFLEIKYEQLKANLNESIKKIFSFLGYNLSNSEITKIIENSKKFKIPVYGEFKKKGFNYVQDPDNFIKGNNVTISSFYTSQQRLLLYKLTLEYAKKLGYNQNPEWLSKNIFTVLTFKGRKILSKIFNQLAQKIDVK